MTPYLGIQNYNEAINHGESALELADQLKNKNVLYSIKRKLALAYHKTGQNEKAFEFMNEAHTIYKETTNAETQEAISDILIKYDTEKKEKEIQENKIQIMQEEMKSDRFRQIIFLLSFLVLFLIALYYFVQQRNKTKLITAKSQSEKEILLALIDGEEKERERLSAELHDGISSTLTSIRFKLENTKFDQSEEVIQMIRDAQIDTRRISHNLSPLKIENAGIEHAMKQFALENSNDATQIHFSSFCENIPLNKETELFIYRIVQELVQNAIKHGQPSTIEIQFFCSENQFHWSVEDDGKGFNVADKKKGQGLLSIENRIRRLNGSFNIDSSSDGTIVQLSVTLIN